MDDAPPCPVPHPGAVRHEITLTIDDADPPAGVVATGERQIEFVGWLDLLQAVYDLTGVRPVTAPEPRPRV
jgi:hypothetical protein